MANTLTAIIPTLQTAANKVARESAGFVQACYKNVDATRAALNQTVNYAIVPTLAAESVTPANVSPAGTDIVQGAGSMTMDTLEKVSWHWTGEQQRALQNGDIAPFEDIINQTLQQAIRTLVNRIENSLWLAAYKGASRAYGTAGTTPFGTANNYGDWAGVAQILDENGCSPMGRKMVLGSAALNNIRSVQSGLFHVNEAGSPEFLRTGNLGQVMGFDHYYSFPIGTHTKGTGTGYLVNNGSGEAVGQTTITLDTGSGTIVAGDVVTFAGTSHKYIVNTGASAPGDIVIGKPGLKTAEADNDAMTIGNNYVPNVAFQENALHLVMRQPDDGGDSASDVVVVRDDVSGLVFQLAQYPQYMQRSTELRCLYGVEAVNSEFIAVLAG